MADEPGSDGLADQSRQVGGNDIHLLSEVSPQALPVFSKLDNLLREIADVDQVDFADVTTHTGPRGIKDILRTSLVVVKNFLHFLKRVLGKRCAITDKDSKKSILMGVGNKLVELREVPAVPFSHSHEESVEIFVELVGERNGLDNHVIGSVDVKLHSISPMP